MKIWLDILSPKQLLLFTSIAEKLRSLGYDVLMTSRRYIQLDELLETSFRRWNIVRVGEWGGGSLEGKLRASIRRMEELLDLILSENPRICLSSGSPEASRIAYGLKIPHLLVSDTPHSPVNRLTAPISERVFTPWIIPFKDWIEAGADRRRIIRYKALDPCFWLKGFKPDEGILRELELEENNYIFFRMPESQAAYLDADDEAFLRLARKILEEFRNITLVLSCRYEEQARLARRLLGGEARARIVDRLIPGASIIYYSTLFIGGGGTMTQEAALLGVPSISIYPGRLPAVHRFLVRKKLVVYCDKVEKLIAEMRRIMRDPETSRADWRRRAERLWKIMEDPFKVVLRELKTITASS